MTLPQKKEVFSRTIGLAGALAYLHDELFLASTGEQLCCYHLDLKPHNILVFEERGNVIWKVSDFGISQIKRIPASRDQVGSDHAVSLLNKVFRPDKPSTDLSSGVDNPRDAGTYTAPEARYKTEKVTRSSDVWSLGCVLSLVLSYLDSQRNGIQKFRDFRMQDRLDDLFYDTYSPQIRTDFRPSLRISVPKWLKSLTDKAKERNEAEGEAFGLASNLIQNHMLLPNPTDRIAAKDVEQKLRSIAPRFAISTVAPKAPHRQVQPQIHRNQPCFLGRFRNVFFSHKNLSEKISATWHFKLPESARRCKFSHHGNYLGIQGSEAISTFEIPDIRQGEAGRTHTAPVRARWSDFSLGSQYLCAAVESSSFSVCFVYSCR